MGYAGPFLGTYQDCGCVVFLGQRYCRNCAEEHNDFTGYLDMSFLSAMPTWLFRLIVVLELGLGGWAVWFILSKW